MPKQFVTAHFKGEAVKEPIICELGRVCEVVPNIFRADVQYRSDTGAEEGWIVLELEGSEIALREAIEYLKERGVQPETTKLEDLPA